MIFTLLTIAPTCLIQDFLRIQGNPRYQGFETSIQPRPHLDAQRGPSVSVRRLRQYRMSSLTWSMVMFLTPMHFGSGTDLYDFEGEDGDTDETP